MVAEKKKMAPGAIPRFVPELLQRNDKSGYDKLLHDRSRLAIVSALAVNETLGFTDLKSSLQISDGNLSVHARKLEDAGYILCKKRFEGRKPHTEYRITAKGRRVLDAYITHMEALVKAMKKL